ncbi:MAG: type II toxin-antitoxin system VapC family toxin [Candidatus Nanohalobium sp.]
MKLFVDTNILVAALAEKGEKSEIARDVLESENEIYTSLLNVMELRTVLTKKKRVDQEIAEETVQEVVESLEIIIPDSSDFIESNQMQIENLLYPQDCLILQVAESQNCELVSFDSELVEHGAKKPEEVN